MSGAGGLANVRDSRRILAMARAWWLVVVVAAVLASGAAYLVSSGLPKHYQATATLLVGESLSATNPSTDQLLAAQRLSATYASLATTRPLLQDTIQKLGLSIAVDDLAARVHARGANDSALLMITAEDTDPIRAAAIANTVAGVLIAESPAMQGGRQSSLQQSVDKSIAATQEQIDQTQAQITSLTSLTSRTAEQETELLTLGQMLTSLRATYASLLAFSSSAATNELSLVEPAVSPTRPASPQPLLNSAIAGLLGLLVAAGLAFVVEYFDDTIRSAEDVARATNLPTLGSVGRITGDGGRGELYRLAALLNPRSSPAEAYRSVRANFEFASVDRRARTLLVTSASPSEGKTITAANLAVVFAQAGRRVLLVDADLRRPGVSGVFRLPNGTGLTTLLRDDGDLNGIAQATDQEGLRILTSGPLPPNPAELLGSQRMRALLERLTSGVDLVIIDSPPVQPVADAPILSSLADATILVIDARRSHWGAVARACDALRHAGASLAGVVLNRVPVAAGSAYTGYYGDAEDGKAQRGRHRERPNQAAS